MALSTSTLSYYYLLFDGDFLLSAFSLRRGTWFTGRLCRSRLGSDIATKEGKRFVGKGRIGVPLQDYVSERRILIIFSRLSTQSDFGWTMLYVTSNCAAMVALLLLIFNQENISYRYDSLPLSHHNIPVNLKSTNWTSGVYTNVHVLWDSSLKLLLSNFVDEDSIMSAQTKSEPSIVNYFTCSNSSARNINETVSYNSYVIIIRKCFTL